MMYGFVSLLSTYYAVGRREEGREGGWDREVVGFGNVLPIFISSCLFGCALGFLFFFMVQNTCENVAY